MGESGIILPDERVELIEGEIIQRTPIRPPHAGTVARLTGLLVRGAGDRAVVWPQNPLRLGDRSMPEPDLVLLRARPTFYVDAYPVEYWIVNLKERCIEVYSAPADGRYQDFCQYGVGESVAPKTFPDLVIEVGALLGA